MPQAKSRFRLNANLLQNKDTIRELTNIGEEMLEAMKRPGADVMGRYLEGKKRMRRPLQARGRRAAQAQREGRVLAEERLELSFASMNQATLLTSDHITEFQAAQAEMDRFNALDSEISRLAAKDFHSKHDERSTRYFFNRAKGRVEAKRI